MIASQDKSVTGAVDHGSHAAAVSFDPRCPAVVKMSAMDRSPKIGIELEISYAPVLAHRSKNGFEVLLHFRMCTVECVPRTASPAAEGHAIRAERFAVGTVHEPLGMLAKQIGFLLGDERCNPDRRFETSLANPFQNALHIAAECGAGFQPIAHRRLVTVIDLNVLELRSVLCD